MIVGRRGGTDARPGHAFPLSLRRRDVHVVEIAGAGGAGLPVPRADARHEVVIRLQRVGVARRVAAKQIVVQVKAYLGSVWIDVYARGIPGIESELGRPGHRVFSQVIPRRVVHDVAAEIRRTAIGVQATLRPPAAAVDVTHDLDICAGALRSAA